MYIHTCIYVCVCIYRYIYIHKVKIKGEFQEGYLLWDGREFFAFKGYLTSRKAFNKVSITNSLDKVVNTY